MSEGTFLTGHCKWALAAPILDALLELNFLHDARFPCVLFYHAFPLREKSYSFRIVNAF
jgi:hypothetical protein